MDQTTYPAKGMVDDLIYGGDANFLAAAELARIMSVKSLKVSFIKALKLVIGSNWNEGALLIIMMPLLLFKTLFSYPALARA